MPVGEAMLRAVAVGERRCCAQQPASAAVKHVYANVQNDGKCVSFRGLLRERRCRSTLFRCTAASCHNLRFFLHTAIGSLGVTQLQCASHRIPLSDTAKSQCQAGDGITRTRQRSHVPAPRPATLPRGLVRPQDRPRWSHRTIIVVSAEPVRGTKEMTRPCLIIHLLHAISLVTSSAVPGAETVQARPELSTPVLARALMHRKLR